MGRKFSINLDPLKDGFSGEIGNVESTAGRYIVVGTNYDHKIISEEQFEALTAEMSQKEILGLLIIRDYMVFYDTSKLFKVDGNNYFIGSFLLVQAATDGQHAYAWLGSRDIEAAKEDIAEHFTELIIDGERYDALYVD